jgi:hypothetical protein
MRDGHTSPPDDEKSGSRAPSERLLSHHTSSPLIYCHAAMRSALITTVEVKTRPCGPGSASARLR